LKNHTALGNALKIDTPSHPPEEDNGIELVWPRIAKSPTRASQNVDYPLEFAPGRRQPILAPFAAFGRAPLNNANPLQAAQTLSKE
jgi:hypothetical protein